ncbi:hypothetical protein OB13_15915 [Pontibacter sp. HJ8]
MTFENITEQIGNQSRKALYQFNLLTNQFDVLTAAVEHIWHKGKQEIMKNPELLLNAVLEEDREAVRRNIQKVKEGTAVEDTFRLSQEIGVKYIKLDAFPIRDESGAIVAVAGLAEDITRQKQFENYLIEFGQRKNTMLEIVSHDLRGPLGIVKSVANLLQKDHTESKYEEMETYTRIITNACDSCTDLINDLLSEEHLRSPEVSVKKSRVDVVSEIRRVIESYQKGQAITQAIELTSSEEPLVMEVDPIKFSQIVNNLISNSIKFTYPDGLINISVSREGEQIVLVHQDNGIGIPENLQPHLFDKYTKAARPGLRGEQSRGIGMSIVRDLVEIQGGRIWFESKENEGSTFYISLPVHD